MTTLTQLRARSAAIDGVRTAGIIAIVAGHTWPNDAWVSNWLFSWHVPVFLVISGYLWNPNRTIREELVKRTRTLATPYATWFLVVCAVWFSVRAAMGLPPSSEPLRDLLVGGFHISRPWSAFWFISALFIATMGMRILEHYSRILPWFIGFLALAWCYLDPGTARSVPFAAVQGAVGILFICVGRLLRTQTHRFDHPLGTGVVLVLAPLILTVLDYLPSLNMKAADLGAPAITVITSTAISCGLLLIAQATEAHWPRLLVHFSTEIARLGLPIILGHALVLGVLALFEISPSFWTFLIALTIPAGIGWLLSKTRLRSLFL